MRRIFRILGKRGRITIPYDFRQQVGFRADDVLSFTIQDDNTVLIKREKLCDDCAGRPAKEAAADVSITLQDFLDSLNAEQQRAAILHLSRKWAENGGVIPFVRAA